MTWAENNDVRFLEKGHTQQENVVSTHISG